MQRSTDPTGLSRMVSQGDQAWRGDRLHPARLHNRFYTLNRLREELAASMAEMDGPGVLRVLDFGCGNMPYLPLFDQLEAAVEYVGADLPGNTAACAEILPDGTLATPTEAYDLVLSTQVLEHVVNPAHYLSECFRVLKPGGHLIVSTHGYWMYHPDPTDFWRWTGDGLRRIIGLAGFDVVTTRGIGNLTAASVQLFQDATARYVPGRLRTYYAAGMQRWAALSCRWTGGDSADDAIIYVITARRPAEAHG